VKEEFLGGAEEAEAFGVGLETVRVLDEVAITIEETIGDTRFTVGIGRYLQQNLTSGPIDKRSETAGPVTSELHFRLLQPPRFLREGIPGSGRRRVLDAGRRQPARGF
jgi:hypothetical protein